MVDFVKGYFYAPDSAWIPTYGDILHFKDEGNQHYVNIGFDSLEIDSDATPIIASKFETLTMRFNERYYNRMINAETLERFQVRLQNRYDDIAPRFEFAYEMYDMYRDKMISKADISKLIMETFGEDETNNYTQELGGSDSVDTNQRDIDTPDSILNANPDYADALSEGKNTTTYGRTDSGDSTRNLNHNLERTEEFGGDILAENIHKAIDAFRNLDTRFVAEFENNFLNIFWY